MGKGGRWGASQVTKACWGSSGVSSKGSGVRRTRYRAQVTPQPSNPELDHKKTTGQVPPSPFYRHKHEPPCSAFHTQGQAKLADWASPWPRQMPVDAILNGRQWATPSRSYSLTGKQAIDGISSKPLALDQALVQSHVPGQRCPHHPAWLLFPRHLLCARCCSGMHDHHPLHRRANSQEVHKSHRSEG